ncbi:DUF4275 family protein [Chakrabartyella piscis]|uniref:DUF4275 family protein n=1 Tax=Chakrabartyella piscis TaxID=2918914 RepID=UPI00295878D1|nr:DUF4275 family protein [Chakrabartyella piscis]
MDYSWLELEHRKLLDCPEEERDIRQELLFAIWEKTKAYEAHIKEYNRLQYHKSLAERGIVFQSIGKANILKMVWTKLFAMSMSRKERLEIFYDQYRWYLFSSGKVTAKCGIEARDAFCEVAKDQVQMFYQNQEEGFVIDNAGDLQAVDLDLEEDVFVFDDVECWTYVHTHTGESFFYYRKQEEYPDGLQLNLEGF